MKIDLTKYTLTEEQFMNLLSEFYGYVSSSGIVYFRSIADFTQGELNDQFIRALSCFRKPTA